LNKDVSIDVCDIVQEKYFHNEYFQMLSNIIFTATLSFKQSKLYLAIQSL